MSLLTRRELLAAFLGAPVAMAVGCGAPRLPLEGEFVGASHGIGHRIRDGFRPSPPEVSEKAVDVLIVGAGVAGLSAAWRLHRTGVTDVAVLEIEPVPGGTSRSGSSSVSRFPWGAHYLPLPMKENAALVELLDEMGVLAGVDANGDPLGREEHLCRDPEERLFAQGRWHEGLFPAAISSSDDLAQLKRFRTEMGRWAAWRDGDGRRAFAIPSALSSDDDEAKALDRITMGEWLDRNGYTSPRLRWLVDYACRDDYGMTASQASAWAGLFYFASRANRDGEDSRPLLTWPEGNGRLVDHLRKPLEGKVHSGRAVTEIVPGEEGAPIRVLSVDQDGADVTAWSARHVVFAAPQFLAPRLIAGYADARPALKHAFEYGSWMVANLTLSDRPAANGFPLCWDNVIEESPSLGYVVATHQAGIDHGPTVLTYYYPLCDDDYIKARARLLTLSWAEWADVCLTDLERAHPEIRSLVQRLDVMRWGHAMIRPRPGFRTNPARLAAAEPFRGIHFAHSDLSGLALFEEAFDRGVRAAEAIVGATT